jgi:hypothetical protein
MAFAVDHCFFFRTLLLTVIAFLAIGFHETAMADSPLVWDAQGSYLSFTSSNGGNGLSSNNHGFAGSLKVAIAHPIFSWVGGLQIQDSSGNENFLDRSGLQSGLSYDYFGALLLAGVRANIIPANHFTIFLEGFLQGGYTKLELPSSSNFTSLSSSSSALGFGYQYHVGLMLGPIGTKGSLTPEVEIGKQVLRANLQGLSPFGLDSWIFSLGLIW